MITIDDFIARHPEFSADTYREGIELWVGKANKLPDSRFKELPDMGRCLYVAHQLSRPPVHESPAFKPTKVFTPHPWESTSYGNALKSMTHE